MVKAGTLALFLILEENLSVFHYWVWHSLWVFHVWLLLCWGSLLLLLVFLVFYGEKMLNFPNVFFCINWDGHVVFNPPFCYRHTSYCASLYCTFFLKQIEDLGQPCKEQVLISRQPSPLRQHPPQSKGWWLTESSGNDQTFLATKFFWLSYVLKKKKKT